MLLPPPDRFWISGFDSSTSRTVLCFNFLTLRTLFLIPPPLLIKTMIKIIEIIYYGRIHWKFQWMSALVTFGEALLGASDGPGLLSSWLVLLIFFIFLNTAVLTNHYYFEDILSAWEHSLYLPPIITSLLKLQVYEKYMEKGVDAASLNLTCFCSSLYCPAALWKGCRWRGRCSQGKALKNRRRHTHSRPAEALHPLVLLPPEYGVLWLALSY